MPSPEEIFFVILLVLDMLGGLALTLLLIDEFKK